MDPVENIEAGPLEEAGAWPPLEEEAGAGPLEEPRLFLIANLTSGTVSSAYAAVIVLGISFGIAAIGALLYYGLLSMAGSGGYTQARSSRGRGSSPHTAARRNKEDSLPLLRRFYASIQKYQNL